MNTFPGPPKRLSGPPESALNRSWSIEDDVALSDDGVDDLRRELRLSTMTGVTLVPGLSRNSSVETFVEPLPEKEQEKATWRKVLETGRGVTYDMENLFSLYPGAGVDEKPFLVSFLDGDPSNPMTFSTFKKWMILFVLGSATFCVSFTSSLFVGGVEGMMITFDKSQTIILLGLSFYVGGFAFGPMVWAPLSELYGRRPIFILTFGLFFLFQIGCSLAQNTETLLICRMIAGMMGSSTLTNTAGVISDTFSAAERGPAMALYSLMPFLGPIFGPVVGGFVGEASTSSWRWLFGISGIYSFCCLFPGSFVPETHSPTILRRRATNLSKATGKVYRSQLESSDAHKIKPSDRLRLYILRPFVLLFKELIVFLFAIYASLIYGVLYLMFGAYPIIYQEGRGWTGGETGLPFLAIGFGMLLGIVGTVVDSGNYVRKLKAAGAPLPPEERLRICCVGGLLLPISLAWLAASADAHVHWIVPTLAGVPFGAGVMLVFLGGTSYLVDTYLAVAASAMAANSFMRSLFAGAFPLFTAVMFHKMGTQWALGMLAIVTAAAAPIPFLFFLYGATIRKNSQFAATKQ